MVRSILKEDEDIYLILGKSYPKVSRGEREEYFIYLSTDGEINLCLAFYVRNDFKAKQMVEL